MVHFFEQVVWGTSSFHLGTHLVRADPNADLHVSRFLFLLSPLYIRTAMPYGEDAMGAVPSECPRPLSGVTFNIALIGLPF